MERAMAAMARMEMRWCGARRCGDAMVRWEAKTGAKRSKGRARGKETFWKIWA